MSSSTALLGEAQLGALVLGTADEVVVVPPPPPPIFQSLDILPRYVITIGPVPGGTTTADIPRGAPSGDDLTWGSIVNGGFDSASTTIVDTTRTDNLTLMRAWVPMSIRIDPSEAGKWAGLAGAVVWDGYIKSTPLPDEKGGSTLEAIGAKAIAEESNQDLLYMRLTNPEDWQDEGSDPFQWAAADNNFDIDTSAGFKLTSVGNSNFFNGDAVGACLWMPGYHLRKIAYQIKKNSAWTPSNIVIRTDYFQGPDQSGTAHTIMPDKNLGTNFSSVNVASTVNSPSWADALRIGMVAIGDGSTGMTRNVYLHNIRVYDIADSDDWVAFGLTKSITYDVAKNRLGYSVPTVLNPASTQPVLPVVWTHQDLLSALFDQMAEIEGRKWAVWDRDSAGKFQFDGSPWGLAGRTWTTTLARINGRPLPTDDVFNQAKVFYTNTAGQLVAVTLSADGLSGRPADPFAGTSRSITTNPRVFTATLDQNQGDSALALSYATALLKDWAVTHYSGDINLLTADLGGIEYPGCFIRAGDSITISDFPGGAQTFRIYGTANTPTLTTLQIGRKPIYADQVLAEAQKVIERRKRWKGSGLE